MIQSTHIIFNFHNHFLFIYQLFLVVLLLLLIRYSLFSFCFILSYLYISYQCPEKETKVTARADGKFLLLRETFWYHKVNGQWFWHFLNFEFWESADEAKQVNYFPRLVPASLVSTNNLGFNSNTLSRPNSSKLSSFSPVVITIGA